MSAKLRFRVIGVKLHETLDEAQVFLAGGGYSLEFIVTTSESYWYAARLNQSLEFSCAATPEEQP